MSSKSDNLKMTRFDARLSVEQKSLFERAARIAGFRSLTDFILQAAQSKAQAIVEKHDALLLTERDKAIFFDALMNPPEPNAALREAAEDYKRSSD